MVFEMSFFKDEESGLRVTQCVLSVAYSSTWKFQAMFYTLFSWRRAGLFSDKF
jgi:hypothetical protein